MPDPDLRPMLLMICGPCRTGDIAGRYEPGCAFCVAMLNDANGLVPPLEPARTREEMIEDVWLVFHEASSEGASMRTAAEALIAAGVIQPDD